MFGPGLVLFAYVLFAALSLFWLWLSWQVRYPGLRGMIGMAALQMLLLSQLWALVRGVDPGSQFVAAFPPVHLIWWDYPQTFQGLIAALAPYAVPAAALTFVAALLYRPLRLWSPLLAVLGGLGGALVFADGVIHDRMCRTAAALGATPITRNSFVFSLRHTPAINQFDLHALAQADGKPLGWSYREMDWYPVPQAAAGNMNHLRHPLTCPVTNS